jgi:LuxR family maltose regulon positive regulatory protein
VSAPIRPEPGIAARAQLMPSSEAKLTAPAGSGASESDMPAKRPSPRPPVRTTSAKPAWSAPDAMVPRRELLERLRQHAAARLVVVQGPAGFGKTVLLRQYCDLRAAEGFGVAWMRMEANANDAAQFLRLLCEAVRSLVGGSNRGARGLDARAPSIRDFARALERIKGAAVIVIDNFEHAANPELARVLMQVIRLLPESVQLCIGTRVLPTNRLTRMRIQEQTVVIDEAELRFRPAETEEFFRNAANLPAEEVENLHQRTDGWPAALQCFRLCIQRGRVHRSAAYAGKGVTPELIDFLATDVFEDLEPEQQRFLLAICVPEKINRALVERITGESDGTRRINEVEQAGLFLTPVDMERNWYRFHNLFRQFLLTRARQTLSEDELRQQHLRVAEWFALAGYREEAIQHYIDAGDLDAAATLLDSVIDHLVAEERLGLIEHHVDQFPPATLLGYDKVFNAAVIAYGFRRAFDKANNLLQLRDRDLDENRAGPRERGLHNHARLFVLAAQDRVQELGEVALESMGQLSERDGFKLAVAYNGRALYLVAQAQFEEAREILLKARPLHDLDGSLFGQAYQEAVHSMVLSQQGRVSDAIRGLSMALRRTEEEASGSASAGSAIAAYLVEALYEQNRLEEAEALIHDYAPLAEQQAIADAVAVMVQSTARMAFNRGEEGEAEDLLDRAIYLGYRHSLPRIVDYARAELVRQSTLKGDLETAGRRLAQLFPDKRNAPVDPLIFHAGETELHTVTWARYQIACENHAEARAVLHGEIRKAHTQRRRRRELKLHLLLAISLNAEGKTNSARRSLMSALELGAPGEFIRSFLDERQPAIRLIRDTRASLAQLPDLIERDELTRYMDRLLVECGEAVLPPVKPRATSSGDNSFSPDLLERLTERELYILRHVSKGLSNKDLADRLSVSINTVKWHLRNIFEKLRISNRVQAIAVARHFGLID